jgi:hypothetical protein
MLSETKTLPTFPFLQHTITSIDAFHFLPPSCSSLCLTYLLDEAHAKEQYRKVLNNKKSPLKYDVTLFNSYTSHDVPELIGSNLLFARCSQLTIESLSAQLFRLLQRIRRDELKP